MSSRCRKCATSFDSVLYERQGTGLCWCCDIAERHYERVIAMESNRKQIVWDVEQKNLSTVQVVLPQAAKPILRRFNFDE